jgi:hypothetical protein
MLHGITEPQVNFLFKKNPLKSFPHSPSIAKLMDKNGI